MSKRTLEGSLAALAQKFPRSLGDKDRILRTVNRVKKAYPEKTERLEIFVSYYGLGKNPPRDFIEIERQRGISKQKAQTERDKAEQALKPPRWWPKKQKKA